jgi:hypothetical protein
MPVPFVATLDLVAHRRACCPLYGCCVILLISQQEVDWGATDIRGRADASAAGCFLCMSVHVKGWPSRSFNDICQSYHSDRAFYQEFEAAKAVHIRMQGQSQTLSPWQTLGDFGDQSVLSCHRSGMQVSASCIFIADSEFLQHFKISLSALGIPPVTILSEEGEPLKGLLLRDPAQPFRKVQLFGESTMVHDHTHLNPSGQLRSGQARETYEVLQQRSRAEGLPALTAKGRMKLFSVSDIEQKVRDILQKAKEVENALLSGQAPAVVSDDEEEESAEETQPQASLARAAPSLPGMLSGLIPPKLVDKKKAAVKGRKSLRPLSAAATTASSAAGSSADQDNELTVLAEQKDPELYQLARKIPSAFNSIMHLRIDHILRGLWDKRKINGVGAALFLFGYGGSILVSQCKTKH